MDIATLAYIACIAISVVAALVLWASIGNKRNKQRVANKHYREIEGDVE
jgi:hypothetical protein